MEIGLVYATKTGHSKKIADEIASVLGIQAQNVVSNPQTANLDLLFVVGGIYGNKSLPEMINYVKSLNAGNVKQAVLITSCVSKRSPQAEVRGILTGNGISVADEFICQGNFLFFGMGHPNTKEIESASEFARKTVARLSAQM